MARTVKPEAVAKKRKEILDAARRLVLTRGYEQVSIQDILDEIQMSSGAFHHYFASRSALLEAFIEQIQQETEQPLLPLIHDPQLTALEKFQGFFDTLDRLRIAHKAEVVRLGRVWYSDANALVRQKVDVAIRAQRAPLLAEIIRQGVQEGTFAVADPARTGEVLMSILQGMGDTHAALMLQLDQPDADDQRLITEIVATHAASMDAVERVLGTPAHAFYRVHAAEIDVWVRALRDDEQA